MIGMPEKWIPGPFAEWLRGLARGDRTLPNCEGERHHYTPEFMLKKLRGPGKQLFQLDKTDGSCKPVRPKDVGWDRNLYAVDSVTGEHDGIIEAGGLDQPSHVRLGEPLHLRPIR